MNLKFISVLCFLVGATAYSQVKTNQIATPETSSNAFLDASENTDGQGTNIGRGLLFPHTDLSTFKLDITAADGINYPTYFDGMIVYNTNEGGNTSDPNIQTTSNLQKGFYYFSNPNGKNNQNITNGKWMRLSDTEALQQANLWTNDTSNNAAKLKNLSDGSTPRTEDKNIFIKDDGSVGIGTKTIVPFAKLDVDGRFIRVKGSGNEGAYIGGDGVEPFSGAGNDVQLGSLTSGVKYVALFNAIDKVLMHLIGDKLIANKIGVGTVSPTEKLHIKDGHIKIEDGTQGAGKVLTADSNGVGTWEVPTMSYAYTRGSGDKDNNYPATDLPAVLDKYKYTGMKITLPTKGKYAILLDLNISLAPSLAVMPQLNHTPPYNETQNRLSNGEAIIVRGTFWDEILPDGIDKNAQDVPVKNKANSMWRGDIVYPLFMKRVSNTMFIENPDSGPKTYYFYAMAAIENPTTGAPTRYIYEIASGRWAEESLVAFKISE